MPPTPTPSSGACDAITGAARDYCEDGSPIPDRPEPADSLDPLQAFAREMSDAAAWVTNHLAGSIDGVAQFDVTNNAFLAQYAVVFAASTVLTLVLWLFAVTKRAVRGAPLTTAFGEAVGLLWVTVAASAFTPLILHVVVQAVDGITEAFTGGKGGSSAQLFHDMAAALRQGGERIGGGPIMLIVVSLAVIVVSGALWLELALRSVALYVGAVFAVVVYAGLVDRAFWRKARVWVGLMVALILIKPIVAICLGISGVFTGAEGDGSLPIVGAGFAVIVLAIFASIQIFRFVPGYGDDMISGLAVRSAMTGGKMAGRVGSRVVGSAAGVVSQGIQAHGGRSNGGAGSGGRKGSSSVSEGMQAHGNRGQGKSKPEK
ncbi:hypothetical protein ACFWBV_34820 [Streptomyces sp. NPDC060030]|uniref:hypothetical protein n=1 Tax=Streptomyces sp. NPDC060030 TaxID=3347042 RepID=UPI0036C21C57